VRGQLLCEAGCLLVSEYGQGESIRRRWQVRLVPVWQLPFGPRAF
jgi:hypothetical protein